VGRYLDAEKCNNYLDHSPAGGGYAQYQTSPVGAIRLGQALWLHGHGRQCVAVVPGLACVVPGSTCPFDDTGSYRVLRGGGWDYVDATGRCAFRHYDYPSNSRDHLVFGYWRSMGGFRLARDCSGGGSLSSSCASSAFTIDNRYGGTVRAEGTVAEHRAIRGHRKTIGP